MAPFSLIFLVSLFQSSYSARILASVPNPFYSHQVAFRPIWKELAKRGHEIVLMTTDPMEETENVRQIDMSFSYDIIKRENFDELVMKAKEIPFEFIEKFIKMFREITLKQLKHPEVQKMIYNSSEKFDLLMIEVALPIHIGLIERFQVPVIGISSLDIANRFHEVLGNAVHPVLYPDTTMVPFLYPLTLSERIISSLVQILSTTYGKLFMDEKMSSDLQKIFGTEGRSMLFINVNPILHTPRAMAPNTIQFGGGIHVEKVTKPLPEDLKSYLDNATNGVIYFSLGSNVKSYLLKDNLKQVFMETLSELPYKVLWKFEKENLPNKPDNVWISKWLPQTDIFRHPNIKLFITQCGLQSIEEAIMNHIPMVLIPFVVDQPVNAKIMERRGLGVKLDHTTLTKEIFKNAIEEVIHNSEYKRNVIETAELLTDVEMTGLEKVVWWTEYVIRNKGAKIFRNTSWYLPFYQYYMLDVMLFLVLVPFLIVFIIKKSLSIYRNSKCKIKKKQ